MILFLLDSRLSCVYPINFFTVAQFFAKVEEGRIEVDAQQLGVPSTQAECSDTTAPGNEL